MICTTQLNVFYTLTQYIMLIRNCLEGVAEKYGVRLCCNDATVVQANDAINIIVGEGVVRRHQHGDVALFHDRTKERQNAVRRFGVEIAGRFVGDEQTRASSQRPGNRHALLLPARQFVGAVVVPLGQANQLQRFQGRSVTRSPAPTPLRRSTSSTFS